MTVLAAVSLAVAALALLFAGVVLNYARLLERQHARERQQLLAKIMHLAGKTWEPPPSLGDNHTIAAEPVDYSFGEGPVPGS